MAQSISTRQEIQQALRPALVVPAIVAGGGGLGAVLLVGALALWFHYGTTVFFETVVSGLAACF